MGGGLGWEVTGSWELIGLLGYRRIPPGRSVGLRPEASRPRTLPNMAETSCVLPVGLMVGLFCSSSAFTRCSIFTTSRVLAEGSSEPGRRVELET